MLYIKTSAADSIAHRWAEWRTGQPMPAIWPDTNVITFQADGDELAMILDAMQRTSEPASSL